MSFFEFPHTRTYDHDLGWLIKVVNELKKVMEEFINKNTITYADPIYWDFTKNYEKNTIVVHDNSAYLSIEAVPSGTNITDTDYWLVIFDFSYFLEKIAKDITLNMVLGDVSTIEIPINSWFTKDYILYIAISDIHTGDVIDNTNSIAFTLESLWTAFLAKYDQEWAAYTAGVTDIINARIEEETQLLTAQLEAAISGVTVDSEVINARVMYNGFTSPTLGNNIRTQFENIGYMQGFLDNNAHVTITGAGVYYNASVVSSCAIPIKKGDIIEITTNAANPTLFAFLDSYTLPVTDNTPADFSNDFPARLSLPANITVPYTVLDDAKFLWILYDDNGTNRAPQSVIINGIDYIQSLVSGTIQKFADKYTDESTPIGRALTFDNIFKMTAVNEADDKHAHCSNFAIDENGLVLLAYYGNKNSYVEDYSDNSDAFIKIRKFYNDAPDNAETILTINRGWETDSYILARGCASNPNVMYNNGKFYIYVSGYFTDKITAVEDFGYLCFVYDTSIMDFVKVGSFIQTTPINILYTGQNYWASNGGMIDLYQALGESLGGIDPYVEFSDNFAYHPNGYYYTFICGIYYKAVLVRTTDFITFEFVALFDDGANVITPEISLQWENGNNRFVCNYRVNDTGNEGTYFAIYTMANNSFDYKGSLTESNSKPAVIKDWSNNIIFLYNIPERFRPIFKRNGLKASMYMAYRDSYYNLFAYDDFPMAVHYPHVFNQGVMTYISVSTGRSGCRVGTDYDTIQFGFFGPIR